MSIYAFKLRTTARTIIEPKAIHRATNLAQTCLIQIQWSHSLVLQDSSNKRASVFTGLRLVAITFSWNIIFVTRLW